MNWKTVETEQWYVELQKDVRELMGEVVYLIERERKIKDDKEIVDYSFLVFPAAKAYEGFLKVYFYEKDMIGEREYYNDHFRIGKALNPDLPMKYRDDGWVYDDVVRVCGRGLADLLWETWKECRNRVFHYAEGSKRWLTFEEAEEKVEKILEAVGKAVEM